MDIAVKAARKAFDEGPWRRTPPEERRRLLLKFADILEKNANEVAALETLDNGKPYTDAKEDIKFCLETIRYYAGWTEKISGSTIPISGPYFCYTREEPVGVCG